MNWSIRVRMLSMGIGIFIGLFAMCVVFFQLDRKVNSALNLSDVRSHELELISETQTAQLKLMLATMDSIVDKDQGQIGFERKNALSKNGEFLLASVSQFEGFAKTKEEENLSSQLKTDIGELVSIVQHDLVTLIEKNASETDFEAIEDKIDSYASKVESDLLSMKLLAIDAHTKSNGNLHGTVDFMTGLGYLIFAVVVILLLPAFYLFSMSVIKPLRKTAEMLTEMGKGHLDMRLQLKTKGEMGIMASALDAFADSLETDVIGPLEQLAEGDLTFAVQPYDSRDRVRSAINKVSRDLNLLMGQIQASGDQINSASGQIADSSQTMSQSATETAASLEEISSSMNEMAAQTQQSAANANEANQLAGEANQAATKGGEQMCSMVSAMGEINEAGQNIGKIIKTIDEIAFQTNLLALNAAVEAARAGQHGKGFAVVAEEVRNLAARSAKAASETAELIEGSVQKAANGTRIAEQTAAALDEIVASIGKVSILVGEIAMASNQQAGGIAEVNQGLAQIDQVVQQNTATAEESAAAAEELSAQSSHLRQMLGRFRLTENQPVPALQQLAVSPVASRPQAALGWEQFSPVRSGESRFAIEWKSQYNTGLPLIDNQHKKLIDIINDLFAHMKDGGDRMLLGQIIDQLKDYTVNHFRTEEDLMKKTNYKEYQAHKRVHDTFVQKVSENLDKLKNGERVSPADLYKFLKNWLVDHIEREDRGGYAPHVKARS